MSNFSKGDRAALKYIAVWLCLKIFYLAEVIGFFGVIGTAGALEQDSITCGQALVQSLIIIASMVFVGFLIYVMEEILPYIRREVMKIIRAEQKAEREARRLAQNAGHAHA